MNKSTLYWMLAFLTLVGCESMPTHGDKLQSLEKETVINLFDDVTPYLDAAKECNTDSKGKQSGPTVRTRWLVSDSQGVAINLDEGFMVQRFPIGQRWENKRPAGNINIQQTWGQIVPGAVGSSGFKKKDTYDRRIHWNFPSQYAGLGGWRMIEADEVKSAFSPCMGDEYRFNQKLFPNLPAGKVAVVMGEDVCTNPSVPRGVFGGIMAKEFCSSANVPAFTFLARKLSKKEDQGYQKIFLERVKGGKPGKSLVLLNNGTLIDGVLDAGGTGFGFMRYPTKKPQNDYAFNFYLGEFMSSKPHGKGQEIKNNLLFYTVYENGVVVDETPVSCEIKNDALVKAFRMLEPLGFAQASRAKSLSVNMKVEQYWLGACPNGIPEGRGSYLLRGLSIGMGQNGAASAYIFGNINMKKGVPTGDMSFIGLTTNGETASAMQTEAPGLSTSLFVKIENGVITRNYFEEQKKAIEKGIWKAIVTKTAEVIVDAYSYCKTHSCNNGQSSGETNSTGNKAKSPATKEGAKPVVNESVKISGGNPYKIECPNGTVRRVFRSSDNSEWRDAGYGGIGLGRLSISELGERLCR